MPDDDGEGYRTDDLSMQRHTTSKQVEWQKVQRVSERLGASDKDGNFPASALQTKDRTLSTLLSLMDGGRFLRAAERFGSWVGKASGRGRQVTGVCAVRQAT